MNSRSEKWKSWTLNIKWIASEIKKDGCWANSRSEKRLMKNMKIWQIVDLPERKKYVKKMGFWWIVDLSYKKKGCKEWIVEVKNKNHGH